MNATKKIMIIPGTEDEIPAIKAAKELGLYVITADNMPENPGHRYADESVNVSILDLEALAETAKSLQINGIMTLSKNIATVPVSYVAEKLGLPAAGPYESVCILQDKGRFRAFLKKHGFNVPWAKAYSEPALALAEADTFPYPVIVKPTDSCGSQGITIVRNITELEAAASHALGHSFSGGFIVEEFLESQGYWSDSDAVSVDGQFRFMTFSAEGFDRNSLAPYVPWWVAWPTELDEEDRKYARSELQRLISLLHMETAIYNISLMKAVNGKIYIMECSPRAGGYDNVEILEHITGSVLVRNLVRGAVGLPLDEQFCDTIQKYCISIFPHSRKAGTFRELWVREEIKDNIIHEKLSVVPGDHIGRLESAKETIGGIVLCFEQEEQLKKVMSDIESYVKVIVDEE